MQPPTNTRTALTVRNPQQGLTLLEMMIVLAIIAGIVVLTSMGFRKVTKGDLVDDVVGLSARLRDTSQSAVETGTPHRLVIDLKQGAYIIEQCEGRAGLVKATRQGELDKAADPKAVAEALAEAQVRMGEATAQAMTGGSSANGAAMIAAIAGHHVGDQQCIPVMDEPPSAADAEVASQAQAQKRVEAALTGGAMDGAPKGSLGGALNANSGIKFKRVFVQHLEEPATDGTVAIYFFPDGSAEKAIIELTDGDAVFSVLVAGLTGRIDMRDHSIDKPDDYFLRNPLGNQEEER